MRKTPEEVIDFVKGLWPEYTRPVLAWSGGKDSMVLLHMLRNAGINMPCVSFKDPWGPKRYAFQNMIEEAWDLSVHTYPPIFTSILQIDGPVAFSNQYSDGGKTMVLPMDPIEPKEGQDPNTFLCGYMDLLQRPFAAFNFPWDLVLVGQKADDFCPHWGPAKLKVDMLKQDPGAHYAFPLRYWDSDDVWNYIEQHKVPVNKDRYDVANRVEWEDRTYNSDYIPACTRCLDQRNDEKVFCPKLGKEINNMWDKVPRSTWRPDYFGE
jgi:hypothetical protein